MFSVIYLRFTSQTIKRDFQKNHAAVLEKFCVNAKDRKYPRLDWTPARAGTDGGRKYGNVTL